jgi:hypothetical protein
VSPVLHLVDLVDVPRRLSDADLAARFPDRKGALHTWGHGSGRKGTVDPHWLAVQGGLPLHTDVAYPRYSYQVLIEATAGLAVGGRDRVDWPLAPGTFYALDTHSPHYLVKPRGVLARYVAVVADSPTELNPDAVLPALLDYAREAPWMS